MGRASVVPDPSVALPVRPRLVGRMKRWAQRIRFPFMVDLFADNVLMRSFAVLLFMCIGAKVVLWLILKQKEGGLDREWTFILIVSLAPFFMASHRQNNRIVRILISLSLIACCGVDLHYNFKPLWDDTRSDIEYGFDDSEDPFFNSSSASTFVAETAASFVIGSEYASSIFHTSVVNETIGFRIVFIDHVQRSLNVIAYPVVECLFILVLALMVISDLPFLGKRLSRFKFYNQRGPIFQKYVRKRLLRRAPELSDEDKDDVNAHYNVYDDIAVDRPLSTTALKPVPEKVPFKKRVKSAVRYFFRREFGYFKNLVSDDDAFFYSQRFLIAIWMSALEVIVASIAFMYYIYDIDNFREWFINNLMQICEDDDCRLDIQSYFSNIFMVIRVCYPLACTIIVLVKLWVLWRIANLYRRRILALRRGIPFWTEREYFGNKVFPATSYIGVQVIRVLFGFFLLSVFVFVTITLLGWFIHWKDFRDFIITKIGSFLVSVAGVILMVKIGLRIIVGVFFLADDGTRIRRQNVYSLFDLLFVYSSIIVGLFAAVKLFIVHVCQIFLYFSRVDLNLLTVSVDPGYRGYCSMVWIDHSNLNPVVRAFCDMVYEKVQAKSRSRDRHGGGGGGDSSGDGKVIPLLPMTTCGKSILEAGLQKRNHSELARFRWFLVWTLMHNPSLCKYRRQDEKSTLHSVSVTEDHESGAGPSRPIAVQVPERHSPPPPMISSYIPTESEYLNPSNRTPSVPVVALPSSGPRVTGSADLQPRPQSQPQPQPQPQLEPRALLSLNIKTSSPPESSNRSIQREPQLLDRDADVAMANDYLNAVPTGADHRAAARSDSGPASLILPVLEPHTPSSPSSRLGFISSVAPIVIPSDEPVGTHDPPSAVTRTQKPRDLPTMSQSQASLSRLAGSEIAPIRSPLYDRVGSSSSVGGGGGRFTVNPIYPTDAPGRDRSDAGPFTPISPSRSSQFSPTGDGSNSSPGSTDEPVPPFISPVQPRYVINANRSSSMLGKSRRPGSSFNINV